MLRFGLLVRSDFVRDSSLVLLRVGVILAYPRNLLRRGRIFVLCFLRSTRRSRGESLVRGRAFSHVSTSVVVLFLLLGLEGHVIAVDHIISLYIRGGWLLPDHQTARSPVLGSISLVSGLS